METADDVMAPWEGQAPSQPNKVDVMRGRAERMTATGTAAAVVEGQEMKRVEALFKIALLRTNGMNVCEGALAVSPLVGQWSGLRRMTSCCL